ncbi:hypothetical protein PGT21_013455 [Puccinia graminis f. sp. tritici]|uniref:Uncharacterized protein n=1 Tax=Puccinia graminis f. sp. tritici TaxID=56615 RepID=A0A5B0NQB2_PUCGR|nr:hypothetical protein PGT21_013455 [Puccinia graminis f. sp. tritici]
MVNHLDLLPNPKATLTTQTNCVCADLQKKLALDPDHLKITLLTSKCPPEERHANVVFANAAFHQLDAEKHNSPVVHAYDDALKDFVRMKAWMFLLIPSLEAYSNNPHKDRTLSKSLYYLTLDALDKKSDDWKEDHLPPAVIQGDSAALEVHQTFIGTLLKYQRSHLRELASLQNCHIGST